MVNQEWTQRLRRLMPFAQVLGLEVVRANAAGVTLAAEWSSELCTADGVLNGGIVMAVADSAGALCGQLSLPVDATGTMTVEAGTPFLAAVREARFTAMPRPYTWAGPHSSSGPNMIRSDGRRGSRTVQT